MTSTPRVADIMGRRPQNQIRLEREGRNAAARLPSIKSTTGWESLKRLRRGTRSF